MVNYSKVQGAIDMRSVTFILPHHGTQVMMLVTGLLRKSKQNVAHFHCHY